MKLILLTAAITAVSILAGCTTTQEKSIEERLTLLPVKEKQKKFYDRMKLSSIKELKDPKLEAAAAKQSFKKWKKYEDQYLSFIYPDDPNIILQIKSPKSSIPIMGGAIGTTDNTFFRSYRLAIGKHTYCLLMLQKTNSFDDGICLCGAVAFQKYILNNNALLRFDLLENGYVKKIQALSDKYRVVVFEWTHMPIQQEPYIKIGASIKFKETVNKKKMLDQYLGFGFLEKGMNKKQVIEILGKPSKQETSKLFYDSPDGRYIYRTVVEFNKNGLFEGFKNEWYETFLSKPKYGSLEWMKEKVEKYYFKIEKAEEESEYSDKKVNPEDYDADYYKEEYSRVKITYNLGPLTKDDIKLIFKKFINLTPKANDKDWSTLCYIIYHLAECGKMDKKILPVFLERYSKSIAPHYANWIVQKYNPKNKQKLLIQQIKMELSRAEKPEKDNSKYTGYDLHNLLSFLNKKTSEAKELILTGMQHPNADIRYKAYFFWDYLPENKYLPLLRKGLKEKGDYIRSQCADAFSKEIGDKTDLQLLEEAHKAEKDKGIKKSLASTIERISKINNKK